MDQGYRWTAGGFYQLYLDKHLVGDRLQHFLPLPPKDVLAKWRNTMGMTDVEPDQAARIWQSGCWSRWLAWRQEGRMR
jgi:hypothetical protein